MAVLVLLEFGNDEEAKAFTKGIVRDGSVGIDWFGVTAEADCAVRAVFKKPTKFCECANNKEGGFTRGRKYGWWVHATCGRPTRAWANGDHWYQTHGTNLLPPSIATEYRPPGWESSAQWDL